MKKMSISLIVMCSLLSSHSNASDSAPQIVSSQDEVYGIIFSNPKGDMNLLLAGTQECQQLAGSVASTATNADPVNGSGVRGAAKGAAAGAAVGAISGNSGSDAAKVGAAVGLVGGRLSKNSEQNAQQTNSEQEQQMVMRNCMSERGFNALN
ncbi:glycine zipper family protein [Photobacterium profundum]|uniref:Glycine-zipper-containing OmpA-like membrane domain-containing protein n=1 Tax=Photobacterium profundum 3TCK TaxID=314280 RepID=Q1Z320_9GAMM|nr:glycine zipper family protein [Photobacterium profundum]EAS42969.1 hypothetical protein P3TCK_14178 [Photobacterium profundum 3TCK]PSV60939.1 glycine zipper family protein [Photobacterium profundum]